MIAIHEDTREQVTELATRADHLSSRSKLIVAVVAVLLFGAFVAFGLSLKMEPSAALTSIDVPEKMFEAADLLGSHQGQQNSFLVKMALFGAFLALTGLIVVALCDVDSAGECMGLCVCVLGAMIVFVIGSFASFDLREENIFSTSEHQHFVSEIKRDDFPSTRKQLELKGLEDRPVGLYLLAQMSIAEGKNQMDITDDVIDGINSPGAGFVPNDKALYAIEHAAYGRPKSEAAIAYRDKLLSWQRRMQWVAMIFGGATVVAGFFLAGTVWVRYAIIGRVRRIESLCGGAS